MSEGSNDDPGEELSKVDGEEEVDDTTNMPEKSKVNENEGEGKLFESNACGSPIRKSAARSKRRTQTLLSAGRKAKKTLSSPRRQPVQGMRKSSKTRVEQGPRKAYLALARPQRNL